MAVRKTKKGLALKRWFKEDWKDVRTGKKCGRQKGEKRGTEKKTWSTCGQAKES